MGRNIRFWTSYVLETFGMGAAVAAALVVIAGAGASGGALPAILMAFPYYLTAGCAFSILMVCFASHLSYLPLLIAMGSTRREALWGFCGYRVFSALLPALPALILWLLIPGEISGNGRRLLPLMLLLLLSAASLGSLAGLIYRKLRVVGMVFFVLIFGCVGGCIALLRVGGEGAAVLSARLLSVDRFLPAGAALWAVIAALDLGLSYLSIRRMEVKL